MSTKEKLSAFWNEQLTLADRRKIQGLGIAIVIITLVMFYLGSTRPAPPPAAVFKPKSVELDPHILEESLLSANSESSKKQEEMILQNQADTKNLTNQFEKMSRQIESGKFLSKDKRKQVPPKVNRSGNKPLQSASPYPSKGTQPKFIPLLNGQSSRSVQSTPRFVVWSGGIDSGEGTPDPKEDQEGDKEKTIYLPSNSIISAVTLSGGHGSISQEGRSDPKPILLRITKPAILPNGASLNLTGCLLSAEGYGALNAERVYLRLLTISCADSVKQTVIDQKISGYVMDSDGVLGLSAVVVAKFGEILKRVAAAKFIEGMGNQIGASTSSTTSATGTVTQTPTSEEVLRSSIGSGIAGATKEISDFQLKLAEQSVPVLAFKPGKDVTAVIETGLKLIVKDL